MSAMPYIVLNFSFVANTSSAYQSNRIDNNSARNIERLSIAKAAGACVLTDMSSLLLVALVICPQSQWQ